MSELNQFIGTIQDNFHKLNVNVPDEDVERLAFLLNQSMSLKSRDYHRCQHGLYMGACSDPIESFAGLFHDIVLVQVDEYIPASVQEIIGEVAEVDGHLGKLHDTLPTDLVAVVALQIFGLKAGESLRPQEGQSEFLSAFVAARSLAAIIQPIEIVQIIAAIQATIPFQDSVLGLGNSLRQLSERMEKLVHEDLPRLTPDLINATMCKAVNVANRDIGNFSFEDVAEFLSHTWELFTELNPYLKHSQAYTITQYRESLFSMMRFYSDFIRPEFIFRNYVDHPPQEELARLRARADRNITIAVLYMRTKLFAVTLLECLAKVSGGDVPLSWFMGPNHTGERLEYLFTFPPQTSEPLTDPVEKAIYDLVVKGRNRTSSFDIRHSPLVTGLIHIMGLQSILSHFDRVEQFIQGTMTAEAFLTSCPIEIVAELADGIAIIAPIRAGRLKDAVSRIRQ